MRAAPAGVPLGIHTPQRLRPGGGQHAGRRRSTAPSQVQGTINGIGERCGNVDLTTRGRQPGAQAAATTCLRAGGAAAADRGQPLRLRDRQPDARATTSLTSGTAAFAHKGGMHVHAVQRITAQLRARRPRRRSATRGGS